jgi:hypothetical protein
MDDKSLDVIKAVLERLPEGLHRGGPPGYKGLETAAERLWLVVGSDGIEADDEYNAADDEWERPEDLHERYLLALDAVACMAGPVRELVRKFEEILEGNDLLKDMLRGAYCVGQRISDLEKERDGKAKEAIAARAERNAAEAAVARLETERIAMRAERVELLGLLMDDLAHLGFYGEDGTFDTALLSNAEENCEALARWGLAQMVTPGDSRYWHIFPDKLREMEAPE